MHRTIRFRTPFVVALALPSGVLACSAGAGAAPTATPTGPVLAAVAVAPGTIAVTGHGFTPGGQVYLAVDDAWGTPRHETRSIAADPTTYGRDGSADPATGFVAGGTFDQRFDLLCGDSALVRAYDRGTFAYTPWIEVDLSEFRGTFFGPNGSVDPAKGYAASC
jgi:hypothetical protein